MTQRVIKTLTNQLQWVNRTIFVSAGKGVQTARTKDVLQQLWIGSDGKRYWQDVKMGKDEE